MSSGEEEKKNPLINFFVFDTSRNFPEDEASILYDIEWPNIQLKISRLI